MPPQDQPQRAPEVGVEFDAIIVDECHRSIYTLWRQVVEYFDASLVGLTATTSSAISCRPTALPSEPASAAASRRSTRRCRRGTLRIAPGNSA